MTATVAKDLRQRTDAWYLSPDVFDPKVYLTWFPGPDEDPKVWESNAKLLSFTHKMMTSGEFSGERFADFGCGPCIHNVLSASGVFRQIFMMEYAPHARDYVKTWLNKEGRAHDWSAYTGHVAKLEGKSIEEIESRVRKKVKGILPCDLLSPEPFDPAWAKDNLPLDFITSTFALEGFVPDLRGYKEGIKKFASWLRPGGGLIIAIDLDQDYAFIGKNKVYHLSASKDFVVECVQKAGLTIVDQLVHIFSEGGHDPETLGNATQSLFICAKKQ